MIAPDICDEGSIFMELRSMEQSEQLDLLEYYFKIRNQHFLSEFFKREEIYDDDLLADEGCYTFFQEVHAHNLNSMLVDFTCIYMPPIDKDAYGAKDAMDILEEKQKEETFVFEILLPKGKVTERKLRSMVAFANYLGMSIYMSVADYVRMKRVSDNLYGVSSIILDLDTYHSVHEYDTDEEMLKEMRPVIDRVGIEPNMYVNSGHGRYLVFSFNNINLSVPEMRKLYQETVKKLIFQFKEFGADAKCTDITRVFRIPGNINPKTGEKAYVIDCFENRVTLSELAAAVTLKDKDLREDISTAFLSGCKRNRIQTVLPAYDDLLWELFEKHKEKYKKAGCSAVFVDTDGRAMTDAVYYKRFCILKEKFIERLRNSDNFDAKSYAVYLSNCFCYL